MITVVLTLVIWMTQSLQRVDLIVENGRSFAVFLYLSVLIIPSLLAILIPFALFGACLYALYRMHSDSEIAVIFAAGVSQARIALPIFAFTFLGALATLYISLDLSPRTYRLLKESVFDIRTDLASSVLRTGEFNKVIDGFTIYVRETRPNNQFIGLLVSDYRKPEAVRTYMAERGILRETDQGPVLLLSRGNLQRARKGKEVEIIPFEEININIAAYQKNEPLQLELTERYLPELLNPDLSNEWERRNQNKMKAEAHNRLSAPFHAFAYVLIALYALIGGAYNRRGYLIRIACAGVVVVGIKVSGYLVQSLATNTGAQWPQYLLPIAACLISIALLLGFVSLPKFDILTKIFDKVTVPALPKANKQPHHPKSDAR